MNGDEELTDEEYYKAIPLEQLGNEGCCKVFCQEYQHLAPDAELWGVRREDGTLAHVFVLKDGVAFDIRGGRSKEEMASEGETVAAISQGEFDDYHTFADGEKLLRDVASKRFGAA